MIPQPQQPPIAPGTPPPNAIPRPEEAQQAQAQMQQFSRAAPIKPRRPPAMPTQNQLGSGPLTNGPALHSVKSTIAKTANQHSEGIAMDLLTQGGAVLEKEANIFSGIAKGVGKGVAAGAKGTAKGVGAVGRGAAAAGRGAVGGAKAVGRGAVGGAKAVGRGAAAAGRGAVNTGKAMQAGAPQAAKTFGQNAARGATGAAQVAQGVYGMGRGAAGVAGQVAQGAYGVGRGAAGVAGQVAKPVARMAGKAAVGGAKKAPGAAKAMIRNPKKTLAAGAGAYELGQYAGDQHRVNFGGDNEARSEIGRDFMNRITGGLMGGIDPAQQGMHDLDQSVQQQFPGANPVEVNSWLGKLTGLGSEQQNRANNLRQTAFSDLSQRVPNLGTNRPELKDSGLQTFDEGMDDVKQTAQSGVNYFKDMIGS